MEQEHLSWIKLPGSVSITLGTGCCSSLSQRLLRYIDDFLFITDDYHAAKRFVTTMQAGFPEYGAFVSPAKTLLSFEYATGSQVAPVCGVDGTGDSCGL